MRSLYLAFFYNSGQHVRRVEFIDNSIEIIYANNAQKQFTFMTSGNVNGDEISEKLDAMLEINEKNDDRILNKQDNLKITYLHMFSGK